MWKAMVGQLIIDLKLLCTFLNLENVSSWKSPYWFLWKKFHKSQTFCGVFNRDWLVLWNVTPTALHLFAAWTPPAPLTSKATVPYTSWRPSAETRKLGPVTCSSANNPACLVSPFPGTLKSWWIKCSLFYLCHWQGLWGNVTSTTHFILRVTFWSDY